MSEFTQGVCSDGTAILKDGEPITPEQIITALNKAQDIARNEHKNINAFSKINDLCWESKGQGKTEIQINDVLDILEEYYDA